MRTETRVIVSQAFNLCREMNERYGQKVTVRQIYYHLFSTGLIKLTQNEYHRVGQFLTKARKRGYIPFDWIEDRSRTPLWKMLYADLPHFLSTLKKSYNKNTWNNQENFVIVLIEKEALAPIIWDIAQEYNVSVFPTKGFSSWSMFVENIRDLVQFFGEGKRLVVLVLSDLDPSGQYIKNDYVNKFQFMCDELAFKMPEMRKIAMTEEQVKKYNLPPMKKKYKDKGVLDIWELDALDPKILRNIVKEAIEHYLDLENLKMDLEAEGKDKNTLQFLIDVGIEAYLKGD